jgi:DNA-binding MarR family transcriptional regulator
MDNVNQVNSIGNSLGYIMINVSWQLKETLRKTFLSKGFDVTADQFAVLLRLWEQDGLSQLELCQKTCKTKSNLTRILDSMEKRELLFRQLSKQDRRSYNIVLTDKGKSIKDSLVTTALQVQTALFEGVPDNDARILLKTFTKLSENIQNLSISSSSDD